MNVLAIDTTLGACSAAISRSGEIQSVCEMMERGHAEKLMPMIEQLRADVGIEFADIDHIAVTTGPGTFTGVRIGVAAARGLALGLGIKMFHATSLQIIALKALDQLQEPTPIGLLTVAMDARRGEIYLQSFDPQGAPLSNPTAQTPDDAVKDIEEQASTKVEFGKTTSIIVGSGVDLLRDAGLGPDHNVIDALTDIQPDAKYLARLAATATDSELSEHVSPLYLRAPDAKPQIGKSILRTGCNTDKRGTIK